MIFFYTAIHLYEMSIIFLNFFSKIILLKLFELNTVQ